MPTTLWRDQARDARLSEHNFKVLRFWIIGVDHSLIAVFDTIVHEATCRTPRRPILSRQGEGGA